MKDNQKEYPFISSKIIADSFNEFNNARVTTFELEYNRYVHSEILTHRQFSRNSESSRAIPVKKAADANPEYVTPIIWGKNKAGMSSSDVLNLTEQAFAENLWNKAAKSAFEAADALGDPNGIALHKQWANRITEPFRKIKVVLTATEFDNFLWLRLDEDAAQPEIVYLAQLMKKQLDANRPDVLQNGEWHMPYVDWTRNTLNNQIFLDEAGEELSVKDALKISASCCAQVSYRNLNSSKDKAIEIYNKLFDGPKPHLSPTEHQAQAFQGPVDLYLNWRKGLTHMDRDLQYWSGNLRGFIQHRQLL